jgi:hypothetical protein
MVFPAKILKIDRSEWVAALQSRWVMFTACVAVCFIFLVARTPYSFFEPMFLAEDGTDYFSDIANNGFMAALAHTHNGYFVFGNVLLSGVAVAVDRLFLGADVRQVPWAVALISGVYFALLASLPLILLRRRLPTVWLLCLTAILAGTPLASDDSGIVGRISNSGYSFVYLALVIIAYRVYERPSGARVVLCDLMLFVCANTNPVVFPLLALVSLPYLGRIARGPRGWAELLRDRSFLSLLGLAACVIAAAVHIFALKPYAARDHLGGPFLWQHAIEMLLAREVLYPVLFPFYMHLRDGLVVFLTAVAVAALAWVMWRQSWRENQLYVILLLGLVGFAIASAMFRPGLSALMENYHAQPLAQYFYGMNMVASVLSVLLCYDLTRKLSIRIKQLAPALVLALYAPGIALGGGFGRPDGMTTGPAPFSQDVVFAVATQRYGNVDGMSAVDGPEVISPSPPYLNGWCRVFVPKSWAVASVRQDWRVDFMKSTLVPIMDLRASRGLAVTGSHREKGVAQLGFFRRNCTWVHENADRPDPSRNAPGPMAEAHFDCRPGDVAFLGDWTGSGETTVGLYRKGLWLLGVSDNQGKGNAAGPITLRFGGLASDVPVTGDWNGDGRTKVGVYRGGTWLLDFNGDGRDETVIPNSGDRRYFFGGFEGDVPVVGDWNASGRDKIGIFRSGFLWLLDNNGNGRLDEAGPGGDVVFPLGGIPGDIPVTGDWNGDGRAKTGVYRTGQWLLDVDGNHRIEGTGPGKDAIVGWKGNPGDIPVVWNQRSKHD